MKESFKNRFLASLLLLAFCAQVLPAKPMYDSYRQAQTRLEHYLDRATLERSQEGFEKLASEALLQAMQVWENEELDALEKEKVLQNYQNEIEKKRGEWEIKQELEKEMLLKRSQLAQTLEKEAEEWAFNKGTDAEAKYINKTHVAEAKKQWENYAANVIEEFIQKNNTVGQIVLGNSTLTDEEKNELYQTVCEKYGDFVDEEYKMIAQSEGNKKIRSMLYDSQSLKALSDAQAANLIAEALAESTKNQTTATIDKLMASLDKEIESQSEKNVSDKDGWIDRFKLEMNACLAEWDKAEKNFLESRLEWEENANEIYAKNEKVWDEAHSLLLEKKNEWNSAVLEQINTGLAKWQAKENEYSIEIKNALSDYIVKLQNDEESKQKIVESWLGNYNQSQQILQMVCEGFRGWYNLNVGSYNGKYSYWKTEDNPDVDLQNFEVNETNLKKLIEKFNAFTKKYDKQCGDISYDDEEKKTINISGNPEISALYEWIFMATSYYKTEIKAVEEIYSQTGSFSSDLDELEVELIKQKSMLDYLEEQKKILENVCIYIKGNGAQSETYEQTKTNLEKAEKSYQQSLADYNQSVEAIKKYAEDITSAKNALLIENQNLQKKLEELETAQIEYQKAIENSDDGGSARIEAQISTLRTELKTLLGQNVVEETEKNLASYLSSYQKMMNDDLSDIKKEIESMYDIEGDDYLSNEQLASLKNALSSGTYLVSENEYLNFINENSTFLIKMGVDENAEFLDFLKNYFDEGNEECYQSGELKNQIENLAEKLVELCTNEEERRLKIIKIINDDLSDLDAETDGDLIKEYQVYSISYLNQKSESARILVAQKIKEFNETELSAKSDSDIETFIESLYEESENLSECALVALDFYINELLTDYEICKNQLYLKELGANFIQLHECYEKFFTDDEPKIFTENPEDYDSFQNCAQMAESYSQLGIYQNERNFYLKEIESNQKLLDEIKASGASKKALLEKKKNAYDMALVFYENALKTQHKAFVQYINNCDLYNEQVKNSENLYEQLESARIFLREKTEIYEWAENTYLRSKAGNEIASSYRDPSSRLSEITEKYNKRKVVFDILEEIKNGKNDKNNKSNEYKEYEKSLSEYKTKVTNYYNLLSKKSEIIQKVSEQENKVARLEAEKENALSKLISRVDADQTIEIPSFFRDNFRLKKTENGWTVTEPQNSNYSFEEYFSETVYVTDVYGNSIKKKKAQVDAEEWLEKMLSNSDKEYFYKVIIAANYITGSFNSFLSSADNIGIGINKTYQYESCPLQGLNKKGKVHGYPMKERYSSILNSILKNCFDTVSQDDILKYFVYKDAFLEGSFNYSNGRYTKAADNYFYERLYRDLYNEIKGSYSPEEFKEEHFKEFVSIITIGISTHVKFKDYQKLCEYSDYNIAPKINYYSSIYESEKNKNINNFQKYENLKNSYENEKLILSKFLYDYEDLLAGIASSEELSEIKSNKDVSNVFEALEVITSNKQKAVTDAKKKLDLDFSKVMEEQQTSQEKFYEELLAFEQSEKDDNLKKAAKAAFGKNTGSSKGHFTDLHDFYAEFDLKGAGGSFIMNALCENFIEAENVSGRYAIEIKETELNLNKLDLAEQEKNWKNMMDLVLASGRKEWDRGLKQFVSDKNNWENEFYDSAQRNLKIWNENYQEFLDDKAVWVENQYVMVTEGKWLENADGNHADMNEILAKSLAKSKIGQISCMEIEKLKDGNERYVSSLFDSSFTSYLLGFASGMAGKAGGYEKKIFNQKGINVQSEKSLESLMGESRKMAKGFIESAVKLSELQAKAQLEKTIEEYMNSIDMINKANIEYTEDLMIKNGYKNEGNAFRKNIMIDATISEVIYKDVFVDSYQAYAPAGGTPTVSRLMKGGDGSSIDNVFGAMDALKEWSETIFGKKDEEGNTKTKEISSLRKWSASEKALALQLEEDWNKTHLHQEKKTKKFNQEVDEIKQKLANDKNETILDGEINEWAGYGPVFRNTSFDIGKGMSYNLLDEGSGQYGKIYSAFSWNSYLENAGISEQVKPDYDKKLWYSESDWFTPPTIRDVIDIAVTVTLTVATGGTAVAPYAALIGLSDNIAFYAMDYGGGYATANEVALGIGKDLLVAGASCGLSFAGDAVEGAINGVEKTLASGEKVIEGGINSATGKIAAKTGWAMTSSYATSVTNNFANSFYIDKDTGKIGFDEQSFGKSFYSASTIAGMVGAGVTTGLSSWSGMELESLGKEGKAIEKFYGGAINLGIAGAGKAAEYGTYLAYAKGDFSQAFDDMGLTLNIADLGSMVDMVSTIGARTNATGQSVLGDLADKLSGQGILELHLSSSGATMNFGTGGTNIAGDLYELTKRMIDKASLENYAAKNGSEKGNAAYWAYVYGDRTQENTAARIASAKDILELAKDGNFTAQTVQNASGNGRIITMKDSGDDFQNAIQLGHEAYRDGRIGSDAAQNAETLQAVLAHSSMAAEMAGDGIELNGLTALEAALYAAGRTDLLAGLASGFYDSSADYWRLMSDGSLAYDGSGWLRDDYGDIIQDENGNPIGADGIQTGFEKILGIEKHSTAKKLLEKMGLNFSKGHWDISDPKKGTTNYILDDGLNTKYTALSVYTSLVKESMYNTGNLDGVIDALSFPKGSYEYSSSEYDYLAGLLDKTIERNNKIKAFDVETYEKEVKQRIDAAIEKGIVYGVGSKYDENGIPTLDSIEMVCTQFASYASQMQFNLNVNEFLNSLGKYQFDEVSPEIARSTDLIAIRAYQADAFNQRFYNNHIVEYLGNDLIAESADSKKQNGVRYSQFSRLYNFYNNDGYNYQVYYLRPRSYK